MLRATRPKPILLIIRSSGSHYMNLLVPWKANASVGFKYVMLQDDGPDRDGQTTISDKSIPSQITFVPLTSQQQPRVIDKGG